MIILMKQLCKICFRHPDELLSKAEGKELACWVNGCMMFHSSLLHDTLTLGCCMVIHAQEMSPDDTGDITTLCRQVLDRVVNVITTP
jgi:hypothetical protein